MLTLEEVRKQIDAIDPQIRELVMKRFDCGFHVAETKFADHSTTVFRADREAAIFLIAHQTNLPFVFIQAA